MRVFLGVKPAKYPDGTDLADVMRWNEGGTETIPPRPVLMMAAENIFIHEDIQTALATFLKNVITYTKAKRWGDLKEAEQEFLRKVGVQSVKEAKRIIKAGSELTPNAPSTIRQKGPGKPPLFDAGLMIKNISYEIGED